jgi:hypothetical protein
MIGLYKVIPHRGHSRLKSDFAIFQKKEAQDFRYSPCPSSKFTLLASVLGRSLQFDKTITKLQFCYCFVKSLPLQAGMEKTILFQNEKFGFWF